MRQRAKPIRCEAQFAASTNSSYLLISEILNTVENNTLKNPTLVGDGVFLKDKTQLLVTASPMGYYDYTLKKYIKVLGENLLSFSPAMDYVFMGGSGTMYLHEVSTMKRVSQTPLHSSSWTVSGKYIYNGLKRIRITE